MKFNIKISRERRFFKGLTRKSTLMQIYKEMDQMASEHERLAEKSREIMRRLAELEDKAK